MPKASQDMKFAIGLQSFIADHGHYTVGGEIKLTPKGAVLRVIDHDSGFPYEVVVRRAKA